MAVEIGQVLDGKYRILRIIGKGGMGAVYEAEHLLIDRRVAVKTLLKEASNEDNATRFEREARAAGRIGNDHILEIFDLGTLPDGSRYMVSELLDGETLSSRLDRLGSLAPEQIIPIARQLLEGLGAAHRAGVLHRDLKPDNVFLLRQKAGIPDFVKIIDFGISKFQQADGDDAMKMTKTGTIVGTPYYMSPEQARGTSPADACSDLYAVGVILYECATGDVPFTAENFNDLLFKIVLETAKLPHEVVPGLDPEFSQIVGKMMARDPEARYQTAAEASEALTHWLAARGNTIRAESPVSHLPPPNPGSVQASSGFGLPAATRGPPTFSGLGATRNPSPSAAPRAPKTALVVGAVAGIAFVVLAGGALLVSRMASSDAAAAASESVAPPAPPSPAPDPEPIPPPPAISVGSALAPTSPAAPESKPEPEPEPVAQPSASVGRGAGAPRAGAPARAPAAAPRQPVRRPREDTWGY